MRATDFSPLFRHSVGFDRMQRLLDEMARSDAGTSYPPYNIEQHGEDDYRITMAVAGFGEDDLDITVKENSLVVSGKLNDPAEEEGRTFLHRGIAGRAFERRFQLADHIVVKGASLENGLLHVDLERVVPDEAKPRKIEIARTEGEPKVLDHDKSEGREAA